jgi:hypothetical protein
MTDDAQSLAEQCGTSVHATEALLCNLQEQKIKHPTPSCPLRRHVPYAVLSHQQKSSSRAPSMDALAHAVQPESCCDPTAVAASCVCCEKHTQTHMHTRTHTHILSLSISISPHRPGQAGPRRHSHSPPGTHILVKRLCLFMLSFTSGFENSNNCFSLK